MAGTIAAAGMAGPLFIRRRHHFSVVTDYGDPNSELFALTLAIARLTRVRAHAPSQAPIAGGIMQALHELRETPS